ncbi:MAG: NADH-quinone oxidoreductase subunit NuoG [Xanthomonadaceae bacterium]|nr:NADH-quinone oxidoreductase subunit NuoG [Xanthomonadaceae bacterium]
MSDEMVKLEVNGQEYEARKGEMLIRVTDRAGIPVPRFCYHEKLTVAANCRMCLVEVEKAPKALPACATPVMDGMKVFTKSPRAIAAQKAVMEFLLINHPLDCPICDQGGECELQDIALGFGSSVSQYSESKRIIKDENLGPLIATEMTRCIHCTRCVRFGEEIAGVQELGGTGRGEFMLINTYVGKTVKHELSGNVIDLCPVGALTSKPFRFRARAWEMTQHDTVSPHDGVGANLHAHMTRGKLMRVVPRVNEPVNETWIADRDRYSYEGVYAPDRALKPQVRDNGGTLRDAGWEDALDAAVARIKSATDGDYSRLGVIASPNTTTEEAFLLAALARKLGCANIDHRLRQDDFSGDADDPLFPSLGQQVGDLEDNDAVLVIGANLRNDAPLVAHRLRKAALKGAQVSFVNSRRFDYLFPVAEQVVVKPSEMVGALQEILDGVGAKPSKSRPEGRSNTSGFEKPAEATGATLAFLPDGGNAAGAWLAGMVPHRGAGGAAARAGLNARQMFEQPRDAYILLGVEPELDALNGAVETAALKGAGAVVVLNPFMTDTMRQYASVHLPVGTWAETAGTFVNAAGTPQTFNGVATPVGGARPAWKVLRVLGNLFGIDGFEYEEIEEVRKELWEAVGDIAARGPLPHAQTQGHREQAGRGPLPQSRSDASLEAVSGFAMYGGDAIVRRAPALQATAVAHDDRLLRVHPDTAAEAGFADGDTVVVAAGGRAALTLALDDSLPPGVAWLPLGVEVTRTVGRHADGITLERA